MEKYRYALEIYRSDGKRLQGQWPITPDWVPANEWVRLISIRKGILPSVLDRCSTVIEPCWHQELKAPYVEKISVRIKFAEPNNRIQVETAGDVESEIPITYFRQAFRQISSNLVGRGLVHTGEQLSFLVCAYPVAETAEEEANSTSPALRIECEEVSQSLPIEESSLSFFREQSQLRDSNIGSPEDLPVFFVPMVLQESIELAKRAGDLETGGILIGSLHRDPELQELFLVVTGQIPANHTDAQRTSLSFTPETWAAVRSALQLRRSREIWVGWWHSHVWFCRSCPQERQATCTLATPFFSHEDCNLQREIFSRALNIALLVTDQGPRGYATTVYGWRQGVIVGRSYGVLNSPVIYSLNPQSGPDYFEGVPYVSNDNTTV